MSPILGHVAYVTPNLPSPDPWGFLLRAFAQPGTLLALSGGAAATLLAVGGWARFRPLEAPRRRFVTRAHEYRPYVPWMLRLSFGLFLIGAGLSRVVFAPDLRLAGWPYLLLTAVGFLLLLGLAVRPAALAGLAAYLGALVLEPGLVVTFEVAGGLAAAAFLGPGTPSLDDLLRAAFPRAPGAREATDIPSSARYDDWVPLLVRIGLGGAFVASGVADKLLIYERARHAVGSYNLTAVIPVSADLWVLGAALTETLLGLAILAGLLTRASAMAGFGVLTLALFALPDDPVVAHVGLFGLSSVLVVLGAGRWSVDRLLLNRFDRAG